MNIKDKLDEWKRQLEQASQYGLFFDKQTVSEMVELIEKQQEEIEGLNNKSEVYKTALSSDRQFINSLTELAYQHKYNKLLELLIKEGYEEAEDHEEL